MDAGKDPFEFDGQSGPSFGTLAAYHLVHARFARWLWVIASFFWLGFAFSFKVEWLNLLYDSVAAAYLRILLFPGIILMVLCARAIRAWIDCQEWVDIAIPEEEQWPPRSGAARINAYHDPLNPQSGLLYLRHFGFWDD